MPEYFKSVTIINLSPDQAMSGVDLCFERADSPPPEDKNVESLRTDFEQTVSVLAGMRLPQAQFDGYLARLKAGAASGLVGPNYNLGDGQRELDSVKLQLVENARTGRDEYLTQLIRVGLAVAGVSLLVAGVLYFVIPRFIADRAILAIYTGWLQWLVPVCLLHPGTVLGVVFAAFILNRTFTFDRIRNYDPYHFGPLLRIVYVSIISYVLLAALWFKVVMLGLGGMLLNSVTDTPQVAILIGLVCGISEAVVVDILVSRFKPIEKGNK